jgi:molybdopterin-guanine dinucleotide biosynthesis protein A
MPDQKDLPAQGVLRTCQQEITAIILAGGKSSRMNEDKGLVHFNGKMLVEHVIASAKMITNQIIIITSNPAYRQFGYPCIEDDMKDKGPLAGIITGLTNSFTEKNLFLGCDMPFITENILSGLIQHCEGVDAILSGHKDMAEPLCAVYDRSCIAHLRLKLEQNQLKITHALEGLKTRVISFDDEDWFVGNEFTNINSIEELNKYKA